VSGPLRPAARTAALVLLFFAVLAAPLARAAQTPRALQGQKSAASTPAAPRAAQSASGDDDDDGDRPPSGPAPQVLLISPRVFDIRFEGADAAGLAPYVTLDKGAPLDLRDVRDSVRALHGSGRFSRVAAYAEELPAAALPPGWTSGVRVVFVLQPIRKLLQVSFPGDEALPETALHQAANLPVNAEYQPESVPRAVESIRAAYYRIGYRNVSITPEPVETVGGVQLAFVIAEGQATRLSGVSFTGQLGLTHEQLAAAFRLEAGNVLNLTELDDGLRGVRARYRAAGYLRARVGEPQIVESGAGEGEAKGGGAAPAAGERPRARLVVPVESGPLVRFFVRGNRSFPSALLVGKLELTTDDPLDAQATQDLAARLRTFYVQHGFLFAKSSWREEHGRDGSVTIAFSVDEGPQVRVEQILFSGAEGLPESQLRERVLLELNDAISEDPAYGADMNKLAQSGFMGRIPAGKPRIAIDAETVYDPVLYARARGQITDLYKSLGYLSARVDTEKLEPIDGAPLPGPAPKSGRWPLRHARVTIPVVTGLRTTVSRLVVEGGSDDVPSKELDAAVSLHVGQPFSYLSAEEGRAALAQLFTKRGYFYCKVEDEEQFHEPAEGESGGASTVEVHYRIQPGPVVHIAYVEVTGQQRTQESLILDLVAMKPGDLLTPEGIDRAQQALLLTGLFFSATITPRNPEEAEPEKTLLVTLRERPRREVQASAGFSFADGPRVQLQWTQANLGGRNLTFSALGRVNFPYSRFLQSSCTNTLPNGTQIAAGGTPYCTQSFSVPNDPVERLIDLGLSMPRLDPLTDLLRGSVDLIHQRAVQYTYNLTKFSAQASVALNHARPLGASLTYEVGYQSLAKGVQSLEDILAGTDQRIFAQPNGSMLFGSLRPTLTLDLRDDPGIPRSGFYAQVSVDYLRSLAASSIDVNLLQLQGLAAAYLPLPLNSSMLFHLKVGNIFLLDKNSQVPGDRRFYLGGAASLRGFNQDALQPQDVRDNLRNEVLSCQKIISGLACTNSTAALQAGTASAGGNEMLSLGAELRVPVYRAFEGALFYDAGNLWVTPVDLTCFIRGNARPCSNVGASLVLRDAVGVGMRYGTPIGRIAIDLGFNLNPDSDLGEPRWGFYFNIDTL